MGEALALAAKFHFLGSEHFEHLVQQQEVKDQL